MANTFLKFDDGILEYLRKFYTETPGQKALREATAGMEMAVMQISQGQAAFMQFLVKLLRVEKYLEVGVFTGYSSLSVALALPEGGRVTACDISDEWTSIGKKYWEQDGVSGKIDLVLAPALETLQSLIENGAAGTYGMVFIDADKENYDAYYTLAKKLLHPNGIILIDNTLWSGKVADSNENDPETSALRALNLRIQKDQEVESYLLPLGDGLTLVCKTNPSFA